jgi:UDP-4-amino-4,6-dideoxy-N-acetyl-beta-L-altrosamine N-acetyltransferase
MSNNNLTIREIELKDLDAVLSWRNDPAIRRYMLTQHEIAVDEHAQWFESIQHNSNKHVLIVQESQIPFGLVHFTKLNKDEVMDWGFYVNPSATKGSGMKLAKLALDFAFIQKKWPKVCGNVLSINFSSRRFHLKLGFKLEGVLREQVHINNEWLSLWCFGLLASEWNPL